MRMAPKLDMKSMSSRRKSMRYDFSQMGTDNGRHKGVMKVDVRKSFFDLVFRGEHWE
jgi:hypothetical protein